MDHLTFAQLLGNYGEFIGAIAVVVTLGYLAIQIRQGNSAARADSRQSVIGTFSDLMWDSRHDDDFLQLMAVALHHWNEMSDLEKTKFDVYLLGFMSNLQKGVGLYEDGILDMETLDSISDNFLVFLQSPGWRQWWKQTGMAAPEVRNYLNQRLSDVDRLPPPVEKFTPHWARLAELPSRS